MSRPAKFRLQPICSSSGQLRHCCWAKLTTAACPEPPSSCPRPPPTHPTTSDRPKVLGLLRGGKMGPPNISFALYRTILGRSNQLRSISVPSRILERRDFRKVKTGPKKVYDLRKVQCLTQCEQEKILSTHCIHRMLVHCSFFWCKMLDGDFSSTFGG